MRIDVDITINDAGLDCPDSYPPPSRSAVRSNYRDGTGVPDSASGSIVTPAAGQHHSSAAQGGLVAAAAAHDSCYDADHAHQHKPIEGDTAMLEAQLREDPSYAPLIMHDSDAEDAQQGRADGMDHEAATEAATHDEATKDAQDDAQQDAQLDLSCAPLFMHDSDGEDSQQRHADGMDQGTAAKAALHSKPTWKAQHEAAAQAALQGGAECGVQHNALQGEAEWDAQHDAQHDALQAGAESEVQHGSELVLGGKASAEGCSRPVQTGQPGAMQDPSQLKHQLNREAGAVQAGQEQPSRAVPVFQRRRRAHLDQLPQWLAAGALHCCMPSVLQAAHA